MNHKQHFKADMQTITLEIHLCRHANESYPDIFSVNPKRKSSPGCACRTKVAGTSSEHQPRPRPRQPAVSHNEERCYGGVDGRAAPGSAPHVAGCLPSVNDGVDTTVQSYNAVSSHSQFCQSYLNHEYLDFHDVITKDNALCWRFKICRD